MKVLRVVMAALALAVLVALIRAIGQTANLEDFWFETQALFDQPWGVLALVNLAAGFALTATIMILIERSLIKGLLWAMPLLVIGNVWTAFWLILRLPRLADLLAGTDKTRS